MNLPHEQQREFFGGDNGDELTMLFDFIGMQKLYLSLARADAGPVADALTSRPAISPACQWATFVRNHDELTLDKLTEDERQEVFAAFGPEPQMQVYGRGLTRRLPPMLDGDPRRIRMAYSLHVFPSWDTGALLRRGNRDGREPRSRRPQRRAHPDAVDRRAQRRLLRGKASKLAAPVVEGGFAPEHVNVADQRHDPDSLLRFMSLLIRRYRDCPELGWGTFSVLEQPHASVLAHRCSLDEASLVALHNLGPEPRTVPLQLGGRRGGSLAGRPAHCGHDAAG